MLTRVDAGLGAALGKRWIEEQAPKLPQMGTLSKVVFTFDFLIFLPLILLVNYTLCSVFTTLAVVENPDPSPSYAALSALDEEESHVQTGTGTLRKLPDETSPPMPDGIVTSSLRATCRHLYNNGGLRMLVRGLVCAWAIFVLDAFSGIFFLTLPLLFPFGRLIADLAFVQLHTAWVHIVISDKPNGLAFWRRLPPFGKTFNATKYAVALFSIVDTFTGMTPYIIATFAGNDGRMSAGTLAGLSVFAMIMLLIRLPAFVALILVQASLLPSDEGTIVPFDRSFGGRVGPSELGGDGYLSIRDALKSLSRASWARIIKMFLKAFFVNVALGVLAGIVIFVQVLVLQYVSAKH